MEINYLKKEMLIHELIVRGIPVDDTKTVDELRSTLRTLLKLEKRDKFLNLPEYNLDVAEELSYVAAALKEVSSSLKTVVGENARTKFERYQSRLVHLLKRVDRIPIPSLSAEEKLLRSQLLVEVLATLDKLEAVSRSDPNLSMLLESARLDEDVGQHANTSTSTPRQPVDPYTTLTVASAVSPRFEPVQKWGLKFSGDPKQMTVHAFLERVNELKIARRVSEKELFDTAIDLFSGKALNWYRSNRDRFSSWRELADLLTQHHEPPDYRSRLFREIMDRTQDPSEGIVDYLATMNALFRRYDGIPADVQLDMVSRNLSPFYTTQLPIVNSMEELESECLKLEAKKYRAEHYVPPPRRRGNLVEPDFAFVETSDSGNSRPSMEISAVEPRTNGRRNIICWNCQGQGHLNRECTAPRKMHCFKCGQSNVTIRNCPKCSTSGNDDRRNQH